ncbi:tautomerase family protein [Nocardia rhizosphaerihabitans]|uniref:tautomerase family protein n=1 Tax=Nocardia rhizosphaerihabitans TaxID=1691570 RepID=UPI0036735F0E
MPLWQLFVPENAYTPEDRSDLAERITNIYSSPEAKENFGFSFPRFYTSVVFHEIKADAFFVGGEPRDKFVQIEVVHIAGGAEGDDRPVNDQTAETMGLSVDDLMERYFNMVFPALKPYIEDRGYECEFHVENAPAVTWRIDGMIPPPPGSEDERRWVKDNKASPRVFA